MELELRLREILEERNMEQRQLAELTGLSVRTISELCNNKTQRYPKSALAEIMNALNIEDMNELIVIKKQK
ncbi:helix-turn-helix domain-containing protein [Bacillus sp. JJ722]|uniref:helix-turn-helix domain-containing protein n=1 Tax=Bacillus sp. JJ722 TaxID=3122973 RepID=UPI002FFE692A